MHPSTTEYLFTLKKNFRSVLIFGIIIFASVTLVVFFQSNKYKSTVEFYTINADVYNPKIIFNELNKADILSTESDKIRILSLAYSDILLSYIIDKFDLYSYYGVPQSNNNSLEIVKELFMEDYDVHFNAASPIVMSFKSPNKYLAADIANEVVYKIDELNTAFLAEHKKSYINIYNNYIQDIAGNITMISDSLNVIKNNYNLTDYDLEHRDITKEQINVLYDSAVKKFTIDKESNIHKNNKLSYGVYASMLELQSVKNSHLEELILVKKLKNRTIKSIDAKNLSTIYIIKKARPSKDNYLWEKLILIIGITFLIFASSLVCYYWYFTNKHVIQALKAHQNKI